MKHIKLFESFNETDYKAISIFFDGGSDLYLGVFHSEVADSIYQSISTDRKLLAQIIDLPPGHDVVVSELGGEGLSTTNSEEFLNLTGQSLPPLVKLGESYDFSWLDDNPSSGIPFFADRNINGFVQLNHVGDTYFVPVEEIVNLS